MPQAISVTLHFRATGGPQQLCNGAVLLPPSHKIQAQAARTKSFPERELIYLKLGRKQTPLCHMNEGAYLDVFRDGWDAARAGKYRMHCPYGRGASRALSWLRGWDCAMRYAEQMIKDRQASQKAPDP